MVEYRAGDVDAITMEVGEECRLESLRQAVVPPYLLIVPFLDLPNFVELTHQDNLAEDGIHGATFTLRAVLPGEGDLWVGFRDLRTGDVVIEKRIDLHVV
jgi:hypothetical protein